MKCRNLKASALVIVSSIIFGFAGIFFVFIKGMDTGPVVFYQLLSGFLGIAVYIAATGRLFKARLQGKRKALFLLGVWHAGVLLSYYKAIEYTNVPVAVLLLYTAPIYVALLAPFVLQERLTARNLAALSFPLLGF